MAGSECDEISRPDWGRAIHRMAWNW